MKLILGKLYKLSEDKINDKSVLDYLDGLTTIGPKERWDLLQFSKDFSGKLKDFEEMRNKYIKELGELVEIDGKEVTQVAEANKEEFFKRLGELLDKEVDIYDFKLPLSKLGDLKAVDMAKLEDFINPDL